MGVVASNKNLDEMGSGAAIRGAVLSAGLSAGLLIFLPFYVIIDSCFQ